MSNGLDEQINIARETTGPGHNGCEFGHQMVPLALSHCQHWLHDSSVGIELVTDIWIFYPTTGPRKKENKNETWFQKMWEDRK